MRARVALASICLVACGSDRPAPHAPRNPDRIAIIAAERGPQGARLVALDEAGDRQFHLFAMPDEVVRDTHPAVSPDGKWLVFASSRGRTLAETSLWIAPLVPEAVPRQLTDASGIDSHPAWRPDGTGIVFASTRGGGNFDLYELAIADGVARGEPRALTNGAGHEVTPSVARDGTIYYAAVTPVADREVVSHIEARGPDGVIRRVTEGPADTSPALSPDERTLVFARPAEHAAGPDGELWAMPIHGQVVRLIELPLTDESGPVWSPDGRYLFATSVLRGAAGNVVFSSVIVIDMQARPLTARLLADRVGAIARLTPAVTREPLDARALAAVPEYLPELARIMAGAIAKHELEQDPP